MCWHLFLDFVVKIVDESVARGSFSWDRLNVWIYGFACLGRQKNAVVRVIGEELRTREAFMEAIKTARTFIPDHRTCLHSAVERTLASIIERAAFQYNFKVAMLLTDG